MTHRNPLYFKTFGYWRVIGHGPPKYWDCVCKCGTRRMVRSDGLLNGRSQSCGCWGRKQWSEQLAARNKIHGLSNLPIYNIWKEIKARCYRTSHARYSDYGGRGIRMDWFWRHHPELFISWAFKNGYKPGLVIDRIDNDGHYVPQNCRFVTYAISNINKRPRK
jgi:hypothetical protein